MEKRKAAGYEAETLQVHQQAAKSKAHAKILEKLNEESQEELSKNILQAEDGNIPLEQQAGHKYSELASKLTSQSSAYHSLQADNRPSNIYQMSVDHPDYPMISNLLQKMRPHLVKVIVVAMVMVVTEVGMKKETIPQLFMR